MQGTAVTTRTRSADRTGPTGRNPYSLCKSLHKGAQEEQHFAFTREQEQHSQCTYTDSLGDYLYEPNASLLKAGAFRSVAAAYSVRKLHPNSHLYTSDTFIGNFPGRIFRIVNQCSFNRKEAKESLADLKKQM